MKKKKKIRKKTNNNSLPQGIDNEANIYNKNLKVLEQYNPKLANLIYKTSHNEEFQLDYEGSKKKPNLWISKSEKYYYSVNNITEDIELQIAALKLRNSKIALFLGVGLGYELVHYLNNHAEDQQTEHILIIEESAEIFKYAMFVTDFTEIFKNSKIVFKVGMEQKELFANFVDFFKQSNRIYLIKAIKAVYHMSSLKLSKSYYLQALKSFREAATYQLTFYGNDPHDSLIGVENMLSNVIEIAGNPGINMLFDKFKDKPAIIVSTGPSLNKNKHLLKGLEDKALIICPDASLKVLLDMGVKPHIVTSIERVPDTYKMIEGFTYEEVKDIYFAGTPVVQNKMYQVYPGPRLIVYRNLDHFKWLGIDRGILDITHSSGNMAFVIADALGCNPIILIGQDLAYSRDGEVSHASGTVFGDKQFKTSKFETIEVMGNDGMPISSTKVWNLMRQSYEIEVKNHQGTCINSTEGGAYIEGTKVMPFKEAIKQNLNKTINPLNIIEEQLSDFSIGDVKEDTKKLLKLFDQTIKDLEEMIASCDKGLEISMKYKKEMENYLIGDLKIEKGFSTRIQSIHAELMVPKNKIFENKRTMQLFIMHIFQSFHIKFGIDVNALPDKHDNRDMVFVELILRYREWYSVLHDIMLISLNSLKKAREDLKSNQL